MLAKKKKIIGQFPTVRLRRNRRHAWLRSLVAENTLCAEDFILPLFVQEGEKQRTEIDSMPGVERLSIDLLVAQAQAAADAGIPAIALFPAVSKELKTTDAKEAYNPDNLVCRAIQAIKQQVPNLGVICDVALDPYTSHGHDGILENDEVANDLTVEVLAKQAVTQARAGCDIIAPSDMMDGRVGVIRKALDKNGFKQVAILSYAAKYASSFYGPFRDAVGSAENLGKADKSTYQMDPANQTEALREVALDIQEGADMVMIKPGMAYLDIIHQVKQEFSVPVFAYQVSGEYAMIKAAGEKGWVDAEQVMLESLLAYKRAGASAILSYAALEVVKNIGNR